MKNFKEKIAQIKAFAFDCDGVLTDNTLIMVPNGEAVRTFNVKDGYAIVRAIKKGYPVAIISGGSGEAMRQRFEYLGVNDIHLGCKHKIEYFDDFCAKYGLQREDVLYVGDDVPDMEIMSHCGISVAPCDAVLDVKRIATHVTEYAGGKGCVRDVIEQVMKARGDWDLYVKNEDYKQ